jgi:hypothetical protein
MTDFPHTHIEIDGKTHKIVTTEAHDLGPGHTHRVHLGCGLTVDTDLHGARHAAKAAAHRARALTARDRGQGHERDTETAFASVAAARAKAHQDDHAPGGRWRRHEGAAADCAVCASVEAGAPAVTQDPGHAPASTVEADQFTGVRCPSCTGEIRKRRRDGVFACTGSGHEFSAQELLSRTGDALGNLIELTKG